MKHYPLSVPDLTDLERSYALQAIDTGWISSLGDFIPRFETAFAAYNGLRHAVALSNGTDALFLALKALGVRVGDEVIVPALTFAAVPAVVRHAGADPVVVDVEPATWNLDPLWVRKAVTPRTKVIIAVHTYGHPADMEPLLAIAAEYGLRIVEDCAEAHGARYRGRMVGGFGDIACYSFYGNKVLITGEGGMALTNDQPLAEHIRQLKDHAMDPNRRYYHTQAGHNCRMTNIQAAVGCAQLERIDWLLQRRAEILQAYREELTGLPGLALNPRQAPSEPVNWMVCAVWMAGDRARRDALLNRLKARGIDNRPFFYPVNQLPPYADCRAVGAGGGLPVTERLSATGFNLPCYPRMSREDVASICSTLRKELDAA